MSIKNSDRSIGVLTTRCMPSRRSRSTVATLPAASIQVRGMRTPMMQAAEIRNDSASMLNAH